MPLIHKGGIYLVKEDAFTLPPEHLRIAHRERRPFLVLGGDTNSEFAWPIVSGCPISSSTSFRTRFDIKLSCGEGGVSKKCWVRVPAVQPILKADLEDYLGALPADRLEEVEARVLLYLGVL